MIGGFIGKPIGGALREGEGIAGTLSVTLGDATLSATATVALKGTLAKTLDDLTLSFAGAVALKAAAAITLDDATLAATGTVALTGALSKTLDGISLSFTGAVQIKAALSVTLDGIVYTIHGGPEQSIIDTDVLQLPVDCVLAGDQPYRDRGREYEIRPMNMTEKTWGKHSRVKALSGGRPSFTSTTGKRGYD